MLNLLPLGFQGVWVEGLEGGLGVCLMTLASCCSESCRLTYPLKKGWGMLGGTTLASCCSKNAGLLIHWKEVGGMPGRQDTSLLLQLECRFTSPLEGGWGNA